MSMFASGLKTLQKRTSSVIKEVAKGAQDLAKDGFGANDDIRNDDFRNDDGPLPQLDCASARELWQLGGYSTEDSHSISDGPMIIRYTIRQAPDVERDNSAFVVPSDAAGRSITQAVIRAVFPIPGSFHFRFKAPTPDGAFGGWIWIDLANDNEFVPVFQGEVCMKVLRIPDGTASIAHQSLPGGGQRETAPMAPTPADCQGRQSSSGMGRIDFGGPYRDTPGASPARSASPPDHGTTTGRNQFSRPETQSPMRSSSPPALSFDPESRRENSGTRFAPARSPSPLAPQSDLMDVGDDFARGMGGPAPRQAGNDAASFMRNSSPRQAAAPAAPSAPPPPPKVFDRAKLVAEREAECAAQVKEAARVQQERQMEEDKLKKDKQQQNNELGALMDAWAKTSDGQNWKDIKPLLSTLHTVVWPNSGWQPCPLSELVTDDKNIKKYYRKAILLCHPDKQKEASVDQQVRADRVFQALNESFKISGV